MIGVNFYMTLEGLYYSEILSNIGKATLERNLVLPLGGMHVKPAVQISHYHSLNTYIILERPRRTNI
jgi:hypothetical protein